MSDRPINLNKVRKARNRVNKRSQADENVVKFARYKAEKERDATELAAFRAKLDSHKRE